MQMKLRHVKTAVSQMTTKDTAQAGKDCATTCQPSICFTIFS